MKTLPLATTTCGQESLHVVQIHPTLQCNLTCKHCYSGSSPAGRSKLVLEDVASFLHYAKGYGFNVLSVSGGEPFIYPQLEALLTAGRSSGYRTMAASNAMLLKSERAKRCLDKLDLIAVSIDGKREEHDNIRNQAGAFDKMLEGVAVLRQKEKLFGFIHTVTEESWKNLLWLADFAYEQGAKLLQLHPLELTGRALIAFNHLLPSQAALHKAYILGSYLQQKYEGKLTVQLDFLHRELVLHAPQSVNYYGGEYQITKANFAATLRSLIVDEEGTIFPLSYGFSENLRIGNISDVGRGVDIFADFIQHKAGDLYALFEQTFNDIQTNAEEDIILWTEMIVKKSRQAIVTATP